MDIYIEWILKKSDTAIQNVYLSDSWKKRTIQNNPAASFCSFLTLPGMSGSPPSFSDYLYFYSFMDRNVHAHFYRQSDHYWRYPLNERILSGIVHFLFSGRLCTDIVLFLIFRIGLIKSAVLSSGLSTGHLPIASEGTSYKMAMPVPFRISPCLSRPEIRRTSVSAI